jgi:hypothetical protein
MVTLLLGTARAKLALGTTLDKVPEFGDQVGSKTLQQSFQNEPKNGSSFKHVLEPILVPK